jgi:hypothetical protein
MSTPTTAFFGGFIRTFNSEADAYVWLVNRFIEHAPQIFKNPNKLKHFNKDSRDAVRFTQTKSDGLTPRALINGWFVDVSLTHHQKFRVLEQLAAFARLKHGTDWHWHATARVSPVHVDTGEARFPN